MPKHDRRPVKLFIMGAARRRESFNARLASLAAECAANNGGTVDLATSPISSVHSTTSTSRRRGRSRRCGRFCTASRTPSVHLVVAGVQRIDARRFEEPHRLDVAPPPAAVQRAAGSADVGVTVDGRRQSRALGAAHSARAPRRARLSGHVLARAGARGVRRGRSLRTTCCANGWTRRSKCFMDLVEAAKHYPGVQKQWVEFLGEHPNKATDRVETQEVEAA